jgi:hypothetical protein
MPSKGLVLFYIWITVNSQRLGWGKQWNPGLRTEIKEKNVPGNFYLYIGQFQLKVAL